LDGDVKAALKMIKEVLIGDIRASLDESHCFDQTALQETMHCFEKCEDEKNKHTPQGGGGSCGGRCDGGAHKECRDDLLGLYKEHIGACRGLDAFVHNFVDACPVTPEKDCCLLPHTTWNCNCENLPKVEKMKVDNTMGEWLGKTLSIFKSAYDDWKDHFKSCKKSYRKYLEKDAKCDCMQAECETRNCEYDSCHWGNCDGIYNQCWGACLKAKHTTEKDKECLEKDRKIDYSASVKIECFVDVLIQKPTTEELMSQCGTADCFSKYREAMYLKCNDICTAVDYDGGEMIEHPWRPEAQCGFPSPLLVKSSFVLADVQVARNDMCRTKHRSEEAIACTEAPMKFEDGRCTSHLDLCYPADPCCRPCAQCESSPCEGRIDTSDDGHSDDKDWDPKSYMFLHYGQHNFLSSRTVCGMDGEAICHEELEHTFAYAYNLCECIDCPDKTPFPPAACTNENACIYGGPDYPYRQHDVHFECSAISDQDVNPYSSLKPNGVVDEA
jgi:hypothetical protein